MNGLTFEQYLHVVKAVFIKRTSMDADTAQAHIDADPSYFKEAYDLGITPDEAVSDDIGMREVD